VSSLINPIWNDISGDVFAGSGMVPYVDNSNLWPHA